MGVIVKRVEILREIEQSFGLVPAWVQQVPDVALGSFWGLMRDFYLGETKLPNKTKELIGIAVSGATRCKYCQLFHAEGAKLAGATDEEIAEASFMGGVTMMSSTFLNAQGIDYDDFKDETRRIVAHVKKQLKAAPAPGKRGERDAHA